VSGPSLKLAAGYTILVMDTNILLSSLSLVQSLVDTLHWTVVVPLPVVMELEGLSKSAGALAEVAAQAMAYVQGALRTHALSLKVQTSRGNYLPNLNVRTERVDLSSEDGPGAWERNMDDLILRAAIWQDEHWVDRSALLKAEGVDTAGAEKVVLLSFDRNRECYKLFTVLPCLWGGGIDYLVT
jgi:protein SMG6